MGEYANYREPSACRNTVEYISPNIDSLKVRVGGWASKDEPFES